MRRSVWFQFAVIAGLWTVYGLFNAYLTHTSRPSSYSWTLAIRTEVGYTWIAAVTTPGVLWVIRRYRLEKPRFAGHLLIYALTAVVYSTVAKVAYDVLISSHEKDFWLTGGVFDSSRFLMSWNWGLNLGLLPFGLIVVVDYAADYYRRYQSGLVRAANLQAQLAQAQLQALKMQLDPHFLFNSLHAISALVHDDPDGAEIMIARLSDLLRLSLDNSRIQEVSLSQELKYLDLYLEIERTRFADRLSVLFDIDPETTGALVPNFILQPLVENAIRHGIEHRVSGGRVSITSLLRDGSLVVKISDNGPGLPENESGLAGRAGVGLATTRARLERLYGNAQSLVLQNCRAGGVEARVLLPFRSSEAQNAGGPRGGD